MSVVATIRADINQALKAHDDIRVSTLRFLISKLDNAKISKRSELTDAEIVAEIAKDAKRHRESVEAYKNAGREELSKKEEAELEILNSYLPKQMKNVEVEKIVDEVIGELGASVPGDIGKVMSAVMAKVQGKADGAAVSAIVRARLSK